MDNQNHIGLKTIGELEGMNFFIPNYQRGYRWTNQQVKDLLNDINEFDGTSGFYCLQPLVVRRHGDSSGNAWEVIDGQQRLTTTYIILTCLGISNPYSLEYETRPGSGEFLREINEEGSELNIDFHYMAQAKKVVEEWIKETSSDNEQEFLDKLKKRVKFIWYESVDDDPIKVFTRLNIGKIPLTNSELIKALFLNSSNFAGMSKDSLGLRQREIANEWDEIEYTMQDDEFWLFLHKKEYDCPTRIDFIFDLIRKLDTLKVGNENTGTDEHRTFRYFYEYFYADGKQRLQEKMEEAWKEIKSYYQTFYEWYDDLECYHYVGFLIASCGNPEGQVEKLVQAWKGKSSKADFLRHLKDKIKGLIYNDESVLERQYKEDGSDKRNCRPLLLFHNIQTVINQNHAQRENEKYKISAFYKFPFHLYKLEGWDVEHINSTTSNPEEDDRTRREWLLNVYLGASEGIQEKIKAYFEAEDNETQKDNLFKEIKDAFPEPEEWTQEEKNRIGNYALLDSSTNRSYGNAIFSAKRRVIIGKDKSQLIPLPKIKDSKIVIDNEGKHATSSFVPPCTKQVFLKYFSLIAGDNNYWTESDAEAYKEDIKSCLDKLNEKDKEERK